jgi:hypothetical protein
MRRGRRHGTGRRRVEGARRSLSCHHSITGKDESAAGRPRLHHGSVDQVCHRQGSMTDEDVHFGLLLLDTVMED